MKQDYEISKENVKDDISNIAKTIGLTNDDIECYGKYKAKISFETIRKISKNKRKAKLILVTATNPTPKGEGKTTTSIGLADAFHKLNKNVLLCLREPSLGPVFGVKGGACGGGYSQVVPMDEINLHFTGDFHAIGAATNLICAMLDNHIYQGNNLNIDINNITIKRAIDMNDRQLRYIESGLGTKKDGVKRNDGFEITVATEMMAIFCLAKDIEDLKLRVGRMIIAYSVDKKPITVDDINATGSVLALLKDAIKPNLVQTLEKTPTFIHGGPFANIAHGCNSIIATDLALKMSDYVVTEAGFGADLGAEKFLDIKCRMMDTHPDVVVIVSTIRALKYNGENLLNEEDVLELKQLNIDTIDIKKDTELYKLYKGISNLLRHIDNIKNVYSLNVVVAINKFFEDRDVEIDLVKNICNLKNVFVSISEGFEKGGSGNIELANTVLDVIETNKENNFKFAYDIEDGIIEKIEKVAKNIYHAKEIKFLEGIEDKITSIEKSGYKNVPICIAKTQYSFSDNKDLLGAPNDFTITIRDVALRTGAGFVVVYTGNILTLPGLPKVPAAERITVNNDGNILGIF